jgi:hypothetical protein
MADAVVAVVAVVTVSNVVEVMRSHITIFAAVNDERNRTVVHVYMDTLLLRVVLVCYGSSFFGHMP